MPVETACPRGGYLDGLGARPRGPGVNKPEKRAQLGRKRSGMGRRPTASFVSADGRIVVVSVTFPGGPGSAAASPSTLPSKAAAPPPKQPRAFEQPKPKSPLKPEPKPKQKQKQKQKQKASNATGSFNVLAQLSGIGKMLLLVGMLLATALAVS